MSKAFCYYEHIGRPKSCPQGGQVQCAICAFHESKLERWEQVWTALRDMGAQLGDANKPLAVTASWALMQRENAELQSKLDEITKKHDVACSTITTLQKQRERYGARIEEYSDVLRELVSYVGCGGYNSSGLIPPRVADEKIRYGIDHLIRVETQRREAAESRLDEVKLCPG